MRPEYSEGGKVIINVSIEKQVRADVKDVARHKGMTMQGYLRKMIIAEVKKDLEEIAEEK